jgi:hypothetical protein
MLGYLQTKFPGLRTDQRLSLLMLCESSQSLYEIHENTSEYYSSLKETFSKTGTKIPKIQPNLLVCSQSEQVFLEPQVIFCIWRGIIFKISAVFPIVYSVKKTDPMTELSVRRTQQILTKTVWIIIFIVEKKRIKKVSM